MSNDSARSFNWGVAPIPTLRYRLADLSLIHNMGIYVEILIQGEIEELWEKTQGPKLHQRWDLRFSDIDYLPCNPGETQEFKYVTRIGAGLKIEGAGESAGERNDSNGQRTSALKFWSDDRKSLISTGSGYWKYVPTSNGIRFITWYDYQTRFGTPGSIVDRLLFRPLLGWATAWSFDRLRLWIEQGISPESSRQSTLAYAIARLTIVFVWIYHGLVPKLICRNPDELKMLHDAGITNPQLAKALFSLGFLEVCFGLMVAILWESRWPLWFTLAAMFLATLGVAATSPSFLTAAFNPVTLNLSVAALAVVALLSRTSLPTAANCLREPPNGEE
jgi:hypothetical protein